MEIRGYDTPAFMHKKCEKMKILMKCLSPLNAF